MTRIVIIGSPGAGKTTLAKQLGPILKVAVYHLDRIFWRGRWKKISREKRIDILQDIVQRKQWIIEGSYFESAEPCLDSADTIIFLDIRSLLCLERIIQRHYKELGRWHYKELGRWHYSNKRLRKELEFCRDDLPKDCIDKLDLQLILKVLLFKLTKRGPIMQKLRKYKAKGKEIIILRSPKAVNEFVAQKMLMREENVSHPETEHQLVLT